MGDEVRADPVETARVAQSYLDNSVELADALRSLRADSLLAASDFGNVTPAAQLNAGYAEASGSAGTALERLIGVLETDSENLYRVAFAYQQADEAAARELQRRHRNIPI